jgi:LPS export ABC transporter protein LptC
MSQVPLAPPPPRARFKFSKKQSLKSHLPSPGSYSRRVKLLRRTFPLIGFFLFALLLTWPLCKHLFEKPFDDVLPSQKKRITENLMLNPQLVDADEKNHPFTLAAESSRESQGNQAELAKPSGKIQSDQDTELAITSERGNFNQETGTLTYKDNVILTTSDGYVFKTSEAQFHLKTHIADGHNPVTGQGPSGQIEADKGFKIDEKYETLRFFGLTKLTLLDNKKRSPDQVLGLFHSAPANRTEIITDQGLICDQNQKQCMAEGHIQVKRGKGVLTCDKLIAHFDQGPTGKQELKMIEAVGHVHIFSKEDGYDATCHYGCYEVSQQGITLKGSPVIKHRKIEIFATGDVIYDQVKNKMETHHRATVKRQDNLLQANALIVYFKMDDKQKAKSFDHLIANGDVIVSSPDEIAQGEHGSYFDATDTAELWGHVVISRHNGQLRGERAKVDMNSGQSQILQPSNGSYDPRVQALLLSKDKGKVQTSPE